MTLKQIKFDDEDLKAVEAVQRMYGCDSFSQAVRLAARVVAGSQRVPFPVPLSPKSSNARRILSSVEGVIRLPADTDLDALDRLLSDVVSGYRFAWREPAERTPTRRPSAQRKRAQRKPGAKAKTTGR